jgi:hypothetical protein
MQHCYFTISMENSAGGFPSGAPTPFYSRHCEAAAAAAAICPFVAMPQDCFAALAMTFLGSSLRGRRSGRGNLTVLL